MSRYRYTLHFKNLTNVLNFRQFREKWYEWKTCFSEKSLRRLHSHNPEIFPSKLRNFWWVGKGINTSNSSLPTHTPRYRGQIFLSRSSGLTQLLHCSVNRVRSTLVGNTSEMGSNSKHKLTFSKLPTAVRSKCHHLQARARSGDMPQALCLRGDWSYRPTGQPVSHKLSTASRFLPDAPSI